MNVSKSILCALAIAAVVSVSCRKAEGGSSSDLWSVPGYLILELQDQVPVNMEQSTVTAYIQVPESENPDVEFGFFLSTDPTMPENDRINVIWDIKMKTTAYASSYELKGTFRHLDCNKTYYYTVYYSLDGKYNMPQPKSFIPGCVELGPDFRWAVCNLGADDRYAYGGYYAWGETAPKKAFTAANYTGHTNTVDDELIANNDAARVTLGGKWRLPRIKEFRELADDSKFEWSSESGCMKVTSKIPGYEGNYILLPKGGMMNDILVPDGTGNVSKGDSGSYLSSTYCPGELDTRRAYIFFCSPSTHASRTENAFYGFSVRPFLAR